MWGKTTQKREKKGRPVELGGLKSMWGARVSHCKKNRVGGGCIERKKREKKTEKPLTKKYARKAEKGDPNARSVGTTSKIGGTVLPPAKKIRKPGRGGGYTG